LFAKHLLGTVNCNLIGSVADPVPNPEPRVFGPSGSGSFYHKAKIVRKTLISTVLCDFLLTFLSLKNDGNVPS
jgi:hypothetical protein